MSGGDDDGRLVLFRGLAAFFSAHHRLQTAIFRAGSPMLRLNYWKYLG
jgi:hypothetical protein